MLLIGIIPIFGMIGVITICCCKVAGHFSLRQTFSHTTKNPPRKKRRMFCFLDVYYEGCGGSNGLGWRHGAEVQITLRRTHPYIYPKRNLRPRHR